MKVMIMKKFFLLILFDDTKLSKDNSKKIDDTDRDFGFEYLHCDFGREEQKI